MSQIKELLSVKLCELEQNRTVKTVLDTFISDIAFISKIRMYTNTILHEKIIDSADILPITMIIVQTISGSKDLTNTIKSKNCSDILRALIYKILIDFELFESLEESSLLAMDSQIDMVCSLLCNNLVYVTKRSFTKYFKCCSK